MTTRATQLKALKNTLASCSKELKKHVNRKKLMGKKKNAINAPDLRKLVHTAGLGAAASRSLDSVLPSSG